MAKKPLSLSMRRALRVAIEPLPAGYKLVVLRELMTISEMLSACDGCGVPFIDRSRNHRRRWCKTGGCGNRAKVAAWRERQAQRA